MKQPEIAYEPKVRFPMNLIYREIVFLDNEEKLGRDLLTKYKLSHFKCLAAYCHTHFPEIVVVFGRIFRWDAKKMKKVLDGLVVAPRSDNYNNACKSIEEALRDYKEKIK